MRCGDAAPRERRRAAGRSCARTAHDARGGGCRRGNSISGLAKAVSSKLSAGKLGNTGGASRAGFSRFDDGQHGVELGGNGAAR